MVLDLEIKEIIIYFQSGSMWIHPENTSTIAVIPYIFSLESWSVLHKWHPKEKIFLSKTLHVFQSFWKLLVCSFRKEDSRQTAQYCSNSHYQKAVSLAQANLKQVDKNVNVVEILP